MPDTQVGNQLFDLAFHPARDLVSVATVAGELKCFSYDDEGNCVKKFDVRVAKRSIRGIDYSPEGDTVFCVGKDQSLQCVLLSWVSYGEFQLLKVFLHQSFRFGDW